MGSQERSRLLEGLFEQLSEGLLVVDDRGLVVDVNDAVCRILGRSRLELIGRPVAGITLPVDGPAAGAPRPRRRLVVDRPDGERRAIDLESWSRIEPGLHVSVLVDAAERAAADEIVLEVSPVRLFVVGPDGEYLADAGQAASPGDAALAGTDIRDRIGDLEFEETGGRVSPVRAVVDRALAGEAVHGLTRTGEGVREHWYLPVEGSDGRPGGFVAMEFDVSGQLALERERRQLADRLSHLERIDLIGQMAAGVAHDFGNLLMAIGIRADLALDGNVPAAEMRELLLEIQRATAEGREAIGRLLATGRRGGVARVPVDLGRLIEDARPVLRQAIPESVEIVHEVGPEQFVRGDRGLLEQVLLNLCLNAGDAMPEGGRLSIGLERAAEDPGLIALTVTDDGRGMDVATLGRIFEPFFSTKAGRLGGLGLTMVETVVGDLGGRVETVSAPGAGTTVRVLLPATSDRPPPEAPVARAEPVAGRTILIVEDDPRLRSVTARLLRRNGYTVLEAVDGRDAIETLGSRWPEVDLFLLDQCMPRMGGFELLTRIDAELDAYRVLFVSGYAGDFEGALAGSRIPFLRKPFQAETLLAEIRRVLEEDPWPSGALEEPEEGR